MRLILAIALGGAIGSVLRHSLSAEATRRLGFDFPYGILLVNVLGAFILGILAELFALRWQVGLEMRAFLTVGVLGGFTTFSAFSLELALMIERNTWGLAAFYILASVGLSVAALFLGLYLVRTFLG
jgi:fluoride exporter